MAFLPITAIIPARWKSTRFPGKPVALLAGRPVILHTCHAAKEAGARVVVATDDPHIMEVVESAGFEAVMTRENHQNGTSRCLEAWNLIGCPGGMVVNLQGDEPFVDPRTITSLTESLERNPGADLATAVYTPPLVEAVDFAANPNRVKVVIDLESYAMYFSRAPIPYGRDSKAGCLVHVGIYCFRASSLAEIASLPPTPLETAENLEQLRWLQAGKRILCVDTPFHAPGIDTPDDLEYANKHYNELKVKI